MKTKTLEQLIHLQHTPSQIRNICILAHVDHGKTTLADAMIASNGIISKRNAGKMRYMDSRPDEQERGITMKSSAITLIYEKKSTNESEPEQFLINLIDSPGHVDFSSEVTTAVRLCDGAVVVVDVVEGVCPQTQAVMRQAWLENIRPVLVLNKLDRLISELKLTPMEAYQHLIQILEQVNLITNQLYTSEAMEKVSMDTYIAKDGSNYDWTVIEDEEDSNNIFFSPDQGNVIFASALDSWGFTMNDFARMYSAKLGIQGRLLHHTMWGDYYLNMKAKRIMKGAQSKGKKPLFVQFVLENIWAVYDAVVEKKDAVMIEKITKSLGLTIQARDARMKDVKIHLQAIMSQWLPLSEAVLDSVVSCTPSPLCMKEEKVEKLMCSQNIKFSSLPETSQSLKKDFEKCNSTEDAPVIVYVSKMFPVERKCLPQSRARPLTEEELQVRRDEARKRHAEMLAKREANSSSTNTDDVNEKQNGHTYIEDSCSNKKKAEDPDDLVFVAFARVFSGVLKKGKPVFFLGPKHNPAEALKTLQGMSAEEYESQEELRETHPHIIPVTVKDLYLLMGRELEALEEVPAGNVLGIGGIEDWLLKSGTLSSTPACPAFTDMYFDAAPIIRVAVEPANPNDLKQLSSGLRLLNQADPCVEVRVQETGENVIIAAGEVHLQRCLDDLRERYAKVELNVSKPIVPFRETVIVPPTLDMVNEAVQDQLVPDNQDDDDDSPIQISTADRLCHLLLRAAPIPGKIADVLLENQEALKALDSWSSDKTKEQFSSVSLNEATTKSLLEMKELLKTEFEQAGPEWAGAENQIWSFGPRRCGPNILLNRIKTYPRQSVWQGLESNNTGQTKLAEFDNSVISGFQMATLSGPLCEEPMHGVCFIVENWWFGNGSSPPVVDSSSSLCGGDVGEEDLANCDSKESDDGVVLSEKLTSVCSINNASKRGESRSRKAAATTAESSWTVLTVEENVQRHSGVFGPLAGQLISSVKEGCRRAFQARPQRLMAAMYKCDVQTTVEVLGKLHGVLGKRFGQVLSEEMHEGSSNFVVSAVLPVVESFGFSEDMRKKTSGLASPQLKFSHWELIPVDPFWVPTTEEEYMHFGDKADAENRARHYMNKVRKRKGLKTDEKIVEFGDKQRTLTKMK